MDYHFDTEGTVNDDCSLDITFPMLVKTETTDATTSQKSVGPSQSIGPRQVTFKEKRRKRRTRFKREDDMAILDLVLQERPFICQSKWHSIAEEVTRKQMKDFTGRNVRERVLHIMAKFSDQIPKGSGRELTRFEKKLQEVIESKEYAEKNPHLLAKRKKEKPPGNLSAITDRGSRENAAGAREDHGYASKIVNIDHEEEVDMADVVDPELSFMTSDAAEGPHCLLTGDSASSPAEPSRSLPTPPPAVLPTPSARVLPNSALKLPMSSVCEQLITQGMRFRVVSVKEKPKDEEYKSKVLALEVLKAENEKRALENEKSRLELNEAKVRMKLDLETRRCRLEEQKLNLMKQCLEQNRIINQSMLSMMETMVYRSVPEE